MNGILKVKDKITNGEMVIGTHVSFGNSCFTELLGDVGYDFIWVDAEHGALDKADIQLHLIAARAAGTASLVRVPWNDPVIVKTILDMGPDGIIFPMICTAEEAKLAVSSCMYPPKGIRGIGMRRANRYGLGNREEYFAEVDSRIWKVMQIEHIDAVKNLDRILEVEGVDAVVVGPNDLSGSIGLLGNAKHPSVMELLDIIAEKTLKHGKPLGVSIAYDEETIRQWQGRGIKWIAVGQDFSFAAKAAKEAFTGTRKLLVK